MATHRRIGLRRGVWGVLLLLVALAVYLHFEGRLPLSGNRGGQEGGSPSAPVNTAKLLPKGGAKGEGVGAAAPSPPSDLIAGRKANLDWLVSRGELESAVTLARELSRASGVEERGLGERYLAAGGILETRLDEQVNRLLKDRSFAAAESGFERLLDLNPGRWTAMLEPIPKDTPDGGALARLATGLGPALPIRLDEARELWKLRPPECVLRVRGDGGGFRYETVRLDGLDPSVLGAAVRSALAGQDAVARDALSVLAALHASAGRPLAAWVLATGDLRLPPAPDRPPREGGR